jgi:hypothetical protein
MSFLAFLLATPIIPAGGLLVISLFDTRSRPE